MTLRKTHEKLKVRAAILQSELDGIHKEVKIAKADQRRYKKIKKHLPKSLEYTFEKYKDTDISGKCFYDLFINVLKYANKPRTDEN